MKAGASPCPEEAAMPTDTSAPRADLFRMVDLPTGEVAFRKADEGGDSDGRIGTLVGYAAVFNTDTVIDSWEGKFVERIAPRAFARTLEQRGDRVKVLFNHGFDPSVGDKPLGKPETMREDRKGLYVEVPIDDTSYGRDLVASLRSGALDGMSFRFSVKAEKWDDPTEAKALPVRTIREVELFEFGPVTFPAYEATTAGVRSRDAYLAWRSTHPTTNPDSGSGDATPDTPDVPGEATTEATEPRSIKAEAMALARAKALANKEKTP
jgi:HK97 family phage prohead protease